MPWQLGRAVRRQTGYDWEELYEDLHHVIRARYAAQARAITARGLTEATRLTTQGEEVHAPRFLADGTLLYESSDGRSMGQIRAIAPGGTTPHTLDWLASGSGFAANGRSLIVSDIGPHRETYFFHDLYRWTLAQGDDSGVRVDDTRAARQRVARAAARRAPRRRSCGVRGQPPGHQLAVRDVAHRPHPAAAVSSAALRTSVCAAVLP